MQMIFGEFAFGWWVGCRGEVRIIRPVPDGEGEVDRDRFSCAVRFGWGIRNEVDITVRFGLNCFTCLGIVDEDEDEHKYEEG